MTWIFVGLGNPGSTYAHTRHNVGFWALDHIKEHGAFNTLRTKETMAIATGTYAHHPVVLCWPLKFMNESGPAILPLIKKYPKAQWLVFHDEMDLPCGKVLLRHGGSARGHNGVKSMNTVLGIEYDRLRIGVDRPVEKTDVNRHVLGTFSPQDKLRVEQAIEKCVAALPFLLDKQRDLFEKALRDRP